MTASTFSSLWYRVADLKPKINDQISIQRQHYRGQIWYVLHDRATGQHHRFNTQAYQFIGLLDGQHSVQAIWDELNAQEDQNHDPDDNNDAPTQDEIIQLLGQLHAAEVMQCQISPDSAELFERYHQHKNAAWKNTLKNPMSARIPLLDPDKFLERCMPLVKPFFSKPAFFLWLMIVGYGFVLGLSHWSELTENISDQVFTSNNLLLLTLLYPIIKILHELGHAFATKVRGGEVHEMGLILLVMLPNPYVNTSAANSFPDKKGRIIVSAAGMMVELLLAALALLVWVNVEAGIVRAVAFNTIMIASVSTLLFNANPLLRFDGYYILSDLIDIPNLSSRANKHIAYLIKRYLFGITQVTSPACSLGEKSWLLSYGIAAFCYRMLILFTIALFIAGKFFFMGVVLAAWMVLFQMVIPLCKQASFLVSSPLLQARRFRALSITSIFICVMVLVLFVVPVANNTVAEGVIWLPEKSQIRAEADGFVNKILVKEGSQINQGSALVESHDPLILAQEKTIQAKLQALQIQLTSETINEKAKAEITRDEIATVQAELDRLREQKQSLITRSTGTGIFTLASEKNLTGRYLRKGELIGYVIEPQLNTARVVVKQKDIGQVRERTNTVQIKLADNLKKTIPATIERQIPAASDRLPSAALGSKGGGSIATDDADGLHTLEKVFQFDIRLQDAADLNHVGSRVYAKFTHGNASIAEHIYRSMRQLFLRQFDV